MNSSMPNIWMSTLVSPDARNGSTAQRILAAVLLTLAFVGCGCTHHVYRGQETTITETTGLCFETLDGQYLTFDDAKATFILRGVGWSPDPGITVLGAVVSSTPDTISWSIGNTSYSAPGVRLKIDAKVRIDQNCALGPVSIGIKIPGAEPLLDATGAHLSVQRGLNAPDNLFPPTLAGNPQAINEDAAQLLKLLRAKPVTAISNVINVKVHETRLNCWLVQFGIGLAITLGVLALLAVAMANSD